MIIELPQVGESVTEGTILQWLKQVGDCVDRYDPLADVLTDKVSMQLPSPVAGVITEIIAQEGQTVAMGAPIARIRTEDEAEHTPSQQPAAVSDAANAAEPQQASTNAPESIDRTGVLLKDVAPVGPTGSGVEVSGGGDSTRQARPRRRYSPAVMRLAQDHGVDLSLISGTGLNGRITRKDVQEFIDAGHSPTDTAEPADVLTESARPAVESADEDRIPLTAFRRMIAANMVRSAAEIPAAWSITEVDVTGLVRRRDMLRDDFMRREGINLTYLPFVVEAVAQSLRDNSMLNSSWGGDAIIVKKRINIGIAVAAPDGLLVPVIHNADMLGVAGIAVRIADLTARARAGNLNVEDVQGGTFTVNNTGALGSVASQPIINHPQAAILTTEAIVKRPVVLGDDAIAIRSMMNICLTFDHRIMDGAEVSAFANAVKRRIEAISPDTGIY